MFAYAHILIISNHLKTDYGYSATNVAKSDGNHIVDMNSDATTISKSIYHTLNCCVRAELQRVKEEALLVI
jgi:hypothetical protein